MSRQFLAILAQLAVILAALAGLLFILKVDPETIKLIVAIGAGLIALTAIIAALSRIPLRRGDRPDDGTRALRAARRARARALRRRLRLFFRDLRRAQPGLRLFFREAAALPLWLVLGPEQHGKSTLLRAAPGAKEHAPLPADTATREPRFFTTAEVAFIELPDDFLDHPGRSDILRHLARRRPRQPIAGILLVARLDALDVGDPLAPALTRARELAADLAVCPPVLLACTHLDRLSGISEFCDGLTTIDRPLGVTLPACDTPDALHTALRARLAEPRAWVQQRAHALLARGRETPAQARLYAFWQHFDALLARAEATITRLVAHPLPGGEALRLRGVYALAPITAPAEARWLDNLAQRVGGAYPNDPPAPLPPQLFVRGLFETEIVRDAPLATRLRPFLWRRASLHALLAVAAAGLAVYSARSIVQAAANEEEQMQRTWDAGHAAPLTPTRQPLAAASLHDLARATLHWNPAPQSDAPDAPPAWGLFRGDRLAEPTARLFTRAVCQGLLYPLATRARSDLGQRVARYTSSAALPSVDDRQRLDNDLFFYTLAASPRSSCSLGDASTQSRFIDQVHARWGELAPELAPPPDAVSTATSALQLFTRLTDSCGDTMPWDKALVGRVQQVLNRTPREEQIVDDLVRSLNSDSNLDDIRLAGPSLLGGNPVPRAFTKQGWAIAKREIEARARESATTCYLGEATARTTGIDHCDKLRTLYVRRYERGWTDALEDLRIDPGQSLVLLEERLRDLTDPQGDPLGVVFAAVKEHTQGLTDIKCTPEESPATDLAHYFTPRAAGGVAPKIAADLAGYFDPFLAYGAPSGRETGKKASGPSTLPLDDYRGHLEQLRADLKKALQNPELLTTLGDETRTRRDQILKQIESGGHGRWTEPLKSLLLPPLDLLIEEVDDRAALSLNRRWCDEIILPMRQALADRYPFVKDSRESASLSELENFFGPEKGAIRKFRDEHLAHRLVIGAADIRARAITRDQGRRLNPAVVDFLDDTLNLGRLLFDKDDHVSLDLTIEMTCAQNDRGQRNDISKVTLKLGESPEDERSFICSAKGQQQTIRWPGKLKNDDPTVFIFVGRNDAHVDNSGNNTNTERGIFGLFRALERRLPPRREGKGQSVLATLHTIKYGNVELRIRPEIRFGGSIFFGIDPKGLTTTFLAPLRTHALIHPPAQLFDGLSFTCDASPHEPLAQPIQPAQPE